MDSLEKVKRAGVVRALEEHLDMLQRRITMGAWMDVHAAGKYHNVHYAIKDARQALDAMEEAARELSAARLAEKQLNA